MWIKAVKSWLLCQEKQRKATVWSGTWRLSKGSVDAIAVCSANRLCLDRGPASIPASPSSVWDNDDKRRVTGAFVWRITSMLHGVRLHPLLPLMKGLHPTVQPLHLTITSGQRLPNANLWTCNIDGLILFFLCLYYWNHCGQKTLSIMVNLSTTSDPGFSLWKLTLKQLKNSYFFRWNTFKTVHTNIYIALSLTFLALLSIDMI